MAACWTAGPFDIEASGLIAIVVTLIIVVVVTASLPLHPGQYDETAVESPPSRRAKVLAPAALGRAVAGAINGTLHTPAIATLLLAVYAAAALGTVWLATTRRDFA